MSGSAPLLARAAVIAVAAIFGLTYSLTAPLIALDLAERGLGETAIGLNAAMHAVGVLLTAPLLPRLVARFGARRMVVTALLLSAVVVALFPAMPLVWLWFPLRLLLGCAAETLFVLSETWINHLSSEESRARAMATYTASLSVGFAAGPLILSVTGSEGAISYIVGALLVLCAVPLVASPRVAAPHFGEEPKAGPIHYLRLAPIAIAATVLNAAIETAGMSFLALYAMGAGWTEAESPRLITALMVGAILLQLPIGWLGDRMDRRRLVLGLAVVSAAGALAWPFVLGSPVAAYATLFIWGGAFVGIYTIMLTLVGSRFKGTDLVGIYAVMGLAWGVGALLGPTLAGFAMGMATHGLPIFAALACAAFCVFMLASRRGDAS
ncbi:MFS transporter [Roseococcus sp. YIM B11640]|uniref:MFS transporter n=1 Tax=Roseococcus sp. YIM B11640 TaxID=3133973 RepID=UPI003C7CA7FC